MDARAPRIPAPAPFSPSRHPRPARTTTTTWPAHQSIATPQPPHARAVTGMDTSLSVGDVAIDLDATTQDASFSASVDAFSPSPSVSRDALLPSPSFVQTYSPAHPHPRAPAHAHPPRAARPAHPAQRQPLAELRVGPDGQVTPGLYCPASPLRPPHRRRSLVADGATGSSSGTGPPHLSPASSSSSCSSIPSRRSGSGSRSNSLSPCPSPRPVRITARASKSKPRRSQSANDIGPSVSPSASPLAIRDGLRPSPSSPLLFHRSCGRGMVPPSSSSSSSSRSVLAGGTLDLVVEHEHETAQEMHADQHPDQHDAPAHRHYHHPRQHHHYEEQTDPPPAAAERTFERTFERTVLGESTLIDRTVVIGAGGSAGTENGGGRDESSVSCEREMHDPRDPSDFRDVSASTSTSASFRKCMENEPAVIRRAYKRHSSLRVLPLPSAKLSAKTAPSQSSDPTSPLDTPPESKPNNGVKNSNPPFQSTPETPAVPRSHRRHSPSPQMDPRRPVYTVHQAGATSISAGREGGHGGQAAAQAASDEPEDEPLELTTDEGPMQYLHPASQTPALHPRSRVAGGRPSLPRPSSTPGPPTASTRTSHSAFGPAANHVPLAPERLSVQPDLIDVAGPGPKFLSSTRSGVSAGAPAVGVESEREPFTIWADPPSEEPSSARKQSAPSTRSYLMPTPDGVAPQRRSSRSRTEQIRRFGLAGGSWARESVPSHTSVGVLDKGSTTDLAMTSAVNQATNPGQAGDENVPPSCWQSQQSLDDADAGGESWEERTKGESKGLAGTVMSGLRLSQKEKQRDTKHLLVPAAAHSLDSTTNTQSIPPVVYPAPDHEVLPADVPTGPQAPDVHARARTEDQEEHLSTLACRLGLHDVRPPPVQQTAPQAPAYASATVAVSSPLSMSPALSPTLSPSPSLSPSLSPSPSPSSSLPPPHAPAVSLPASSSSSRSPLHLQANLHRQAHPHLHPHSYSQPHTYPRSPSARSPCEYAKGKPLHPPAEPPAGALTAVPSTATTAAPTPASASAPTPASASGPARTPLLQRPAVTTGKVSSPTARVREMCAAYESMARGKSGGVRS